LALWLLLLHDMFDVMHAQALPSHVCSTLTLVVNNPHGYVLLVLLQAAISRTARKKKQQNKILFESTTRHVESKTTTGSTIESKHNHRRRHGKLHFRSGLDGY